MLKDILNKIKSGYELRFDELVYIISLKKQDELEILFSKALETKNKLCGNKIYIRGLIELSNLCSKDCYYCGIRKSNKETKRYTIPFDEVIREIEFAYQNKYSSIVLQAGERNDKNFIKLVSEILENINKMTNNKLRVTLSLGEQSDDTYQEWFEKGAHRYLLRAETTNPELYTKIHPLNHSFNNRMKCLYTLKKIGYQLGTGVLIGLPGQTAEDLANDILFYKKIDVDMIGMGPYIPHKNTPLGLDTIKFNRNKALNLGLKMIAATRLSLPDINIAATTALEALSPESGLETGILAGANVFMINLNDYCYKKSYFLYDDKPCTNTNIKLFQQKINERLSRISQRVAYGEYGDSMHYLNKIKPV